LAVNYYDSSTKQKIHQTKLKVPSFLPEKLEQIKFYVYYIS
jgi:hypothetical protein